LGLSICKRITEAHGGTIKVEPKPGRGALFVVTIPKTT
jgi:signal transduction histidine kinase